METLLYQPTDHITTLIIILLAGTNVSDLISLYHEIDAMPIGAGLLYAEPAILRKPISNHEHTKEAIITYITALVARLIIQQFS